MRTIPKRSNIRVMVKVPGTCILTRVYGGGRLVSVCKGCLFGGITGDLGGFAYLVPRLGPKHEGGIVRGIYCTQKLVQYSNTHPSEIKLERIERCCLLPSPTIHNMYTV